MSKATVAAKQREYKKNIENITDLFGGVIPPNLKVGQVLKFEKATLRITKIKRKRQQIWGEHINLISEVNYNSHMGHQIDNGSDALEKYGLPYCLDCQEPLSEKARPEGDSLARLRKMKDLEDQTIN